MKSFRLFREIEGHAAGLYRTLVRVVNEAGQGAEAPLFVQVFAGEDGPVETIPVDVRATNAAAGVVNLRLKAHRSECCFPLFAGTLELVENKGRGPCIRMRGTYLVPLARGRAQRSLQARRRAEAALEAFLDTVIGEAERQSVA